MDKEDLKIGTEGSFFPPFDKGINNVKKIEEYGYDSVWFADHLMGWVPESIWTPDIIKLANSFESPHFFYDSICMLAISAWDTQGIQLGTAVTETFRRNPAVLAQAFLTLDHISKGRAILGIGAGEGENVIPYGIKWSNPVGRLEESLKIIRLLWENDKKVNFKGKFWQLKDAISVIKPYKEGIYPPIWIAAMGPRMLDITARLADGWLPLNLDLKSYKEKLDIIKNSAKKADRNPDEEITPALWCYLIVDEDSQECNRMITTPIAKNFVLMTSSENFKRHGFTHPLGENFYGLLNYIPTKYDQETMLSILEQIPIKMCEENFVLQGTPDEIIKKIEDYVKIGLKHIVLYNITYYCDASKIKSSFNCMKKILNYFKG